VDTSGEDGEFDGAVDASSEDDRHSVGAEKRRPTGHIGGRRPSRAAHRRSTSNDEEDSYSGSDGEEVEELPSGGARRHHHVTARPRGAGSVRAVPRGGARPATRDRGEDSGDDSPARRSSTAFSWRSNDTTSQATPSRDDEESGWADLFGPPLSTGDDRFTSAFETFSERVRGGEADASGRRRPRTGLPFVTAALVPWAGLHSWFNAPQASSLRHGLALTSHRFPPFLGLSTVFHVVFDRAPQALQPPENVGVSAYVAHPTQLFRDSSRILRPKAGALRDARTWLTQVRDTAATEWLARSSTAGRDTFARWLRHNQVKRHHVPEWAHFECAQVLALEAMWADATLASLPEWDRTLAAAAQAHELAVRADRYDEAQWAFVTLSLALLLPGLFRPPIGSLARQYVGSFRSALDSPGEVGPERYKARHVLRDVRPGTARDSSRDASHSRDHGSGGGGGRGRPFPPPNRRRPKKDGPTDSEAKSRHTGSDTAPQASTASMAAQGAPGAFAGAGESASSNGTFPSRRLTGKDVPTSSGPPASSARGPPTPVDSAPEDAPLLHEVRVLDSTGAARTTSLVLPTATRSAESSVAPSQGPQPATPLLGDLMPSWRGPARRNELVQLLSNPGTSSVDGATPCSADAAAMADMVHAALSPLRRMSARHPRDAAASRIASVDLNTDPPARLHAVADDFAAAAADDGGVFPAASGNALLAYMSAFERHPLPWPTTADSMLWLASLDHGIPLHHLLLPSAATLLAEPTAFGSGVVSASVVAHELARRGHLQPEVLREVPERTTTRVAAAMAKAVPGLVRRGILERYEPAVHGPVCLLSDAFQTARYWWAPSMTAPEPGAHVPLPPARTATSKRLVLHGAAVSTLLKQLPFAYPSHADMATLVARANYLAVADIKAGFHGLLLHPRSRALLGLRVGDDVYVHCRLPFGTSASPALFTAVSAAVLRVAEAVATARAIPGAYTVFVDDFLVTGDTVQDTDARLSILRGVCAAVGFATPRAKIQPVATSATYLGLLWTAGTDAQVELAARFRKKLTSAFAAMEQQLSTGHLVSKALLQSVIGHCIWYARAFPEARPYLRGFARALYKPARGGLISLASKRARADLEFWGGELRQPPRRAPCTPRGRTVRIVSDAGDAGAAAVVMVDGGEPYLLHMQYPDALADASTTRELFAVVAAMTWVTEQYPPPFRLHCTTDSSASCFLMLSGSSPRAGQSALLAHLARLTWRHGGDVTPTWAPRATLHMVDAAAAGSEAAERLALAYGAVYHRLPAETLTPLTRLPPLADLPLRRSPLFACAEESSQLDCDTTAGPVVSTPGTQLVPGSSGAAGIITSSDDDAPFDASAPGPPVETVNTSTVQIAAQAVPRLRRGQQPPREKSANSRARPALHRAPPRPPALPSTPPRRDNASVGLNRRHVNARCTWDPGGSCDAGASGPSPPRCKARGRTLSACC